MPTANDRRRRDLLRLSHAIIRAQKPIRVLLAVTWPDAVRTRFLRKGGTALPEVAYAPLRFDADAHDAAFREIARACDRHDPIQQILRATAIQYRRVLAMLAARGTSRFLRHSRALYGSADDRLADGHLTNLDLARHLGNVLGGRLATDLGQAPAERFSAQSAARRLRKRFDRVFGRGAVAVEVSTSVTADAAAGAGRLRLRRGRRFSLETLDYLEQHEGYVHIATTLNGRAQPVLPVLGKASPRVVKYNEGLAVFGEWASGTLTAERLQRLAERVLFIHLAEQGADFLDLYRTALATGGTPGDAYDRAARIFRGGDPRGGSFLTKDVAYLDHFVRVFNFFRVTMLEGRTHVFDLLFAGKVAFEDLPALAEARREGILEPPRFLPPWLARPDWLAAHLGLSSFLNQMNLENIRLHYETLLRQCPPPPAGAIDPHGRWSGVGRGV